LFRLLQEQIGERLDLHSGAITEAVVDERLQSAGVPADVLNELHALFTLCNQARYAPSGTAEELEAVSARAERVLQILRQMEMVRA
jgi:hypothetical protein